jgi:hypothetical protein
VQVVGVGSCVSLSQPPLTKDGGEGATAAVFFGANDAVRRCCQAQRAAATTAFPGCCRQRHRALRATGRSESPAMRAWLNTCEAFV